MNQGKRCVFTKLTFKTLNQMIPPLNITVQVIYSFFVESSLVAQYAVREKSPVTTSRQDNTVYHQIIYFRIIKAMVKTLILCL